VLLAHTPALERPFKHRGFPEGPQQQAVRFGEAARGCPSCGKVSKIILLERGEGEAGA
jgi:hypothetical protein